MRTRHYTHQLPLKNDHGDKYRADWERLSRAFYEDNHVGKTEAALEAYAADLDKAWDTCTREAYEGARVRMATVETMAREDASNVADADALAAKASSPCRRLGLAALLPLACAARQQYKECATAAALLPYNVDDSVLQLVARKDRPRRAFRCVLWSVRCTQHRIR